MKKSHTFLRFVFPICLFIASFSFAIGQEVDGFSVTIDSENQFSFAPTCGGVDCPGNFSEKYHLLWDFGDGEYSFQWAPTKIYDAEGESFTPKLMVTGIKDEDGNDEDEPDLLVTNTITGDAQDIGATVTAPPSLEPFPQITVNANPKAGFRFYVMLRFTDLTVTGYDISHYLEYPASVSVAKDSDGQDIIYYNTEAGVTVENGLMNQISVDGTVPDNEFFDVVIQFIASPDLTTRDNVSFRLVYDPPLEVGQSQTQVQSKGSPFTLPVVSAWDPNHKTTDSEVISPGQEIWYTIQFRNEGAATANAVIITDQLSPMLDWSSAGNFSAWDAVDPAPSVDGSGKLTFNIPFCALTTFESNPGYSDGWVKFSIKAKPDLSPGDTIYNHASVIFDSEAPMVTDTSKNYIPLKTGTDECDCSEETDHLRWWMALMLLIIIILLAILALMYKKYKNNTSSGI